MKRPDKKRKKGMGIHVFESIIEIWNRILGRKKNATKKGNKSKNIRKKSKDRVTSRKAKKASPGDSVLSQEGSQEEKS